MGTAIVSQFSCASKFVVVFHYFNINSDNFPNAGTHSIVLLVFRQLIRDINIIIMTFIYYYFWVCVCVCITIDDYRRTALSLAIFIHSTVRAAFFFLLNFCMFSVYFLDFWVIAALSNSDDWLASITLANRKHMFWYHEMPYEHSVQSIAFRRQMSFCVRLLKSILLFFDR